MTTIVVSSDWHGDADTMGFDRFDDVSAAVDASVEMAIELRAAMYIMAGDLCDPGRRSSRAVAMAARGAARLDSEGILPVFITGNHDVLEDGSGDHVMMPLVSAGAVVIDRPMVYAAYGRRRINLVALPFTPRSHSYDPDSFIRDQVPTQLNKAAPTLVVGHLNLEGIAVGSESTEMARGRDVFWPLAALEDCLPDALLVAGHYHAPQVYKGVHVCGSIARLRFDEAGNDPGFLVLEVG